jgi:hypothetical protein
MKSYNQHTVHELVTTHLGKYTVYVSNNLDFTNPEDDEVWNIVHTSVKNEMCDGKIGSLFSFYMSSILSSDLIEFDTEEEARKFYSIFEQVGVYSSSVFACIYSPTSGALNENT